jgi:hypothetical protein
MIFVYTITFVLLTAYAILLGYYHRGFKQMPENDNIPADFIPTTTVTVLIPARNEENNIGPA